MGSKSAELTPAATYLSSANLSVLNDVRGAAPPTSVSLSESKLRSILSYLDEMEKTEGETLGQKSRGKGRKERGGGRGGGGGGGKEEEEVVGGNE